MLCLAGFLCAWSWQKRGHGLKAYGSYLLDRGIRIIPAYFIFLAVYLHSGSWFTDFINLNWHLTPNFEYSLWTFVSNILMSRGTESGVALEGMFAINMGMQLFVLMGFVLAMVRDRRKVVAVALLLELVALVLRFFNLADGPWGNYFFTFTRLDGFVAGLLMALGLGDARIRNFLVQKRNVLWLAAASLLAVGGVLTKGYSLFNTVTTSWLAYPCLAVFAACLMLWASQKTTMWRPFLWVSRLGRFAYCTYLVKIPTTYLVFRLAKNMGIPDNLVSLLLILAATELVCFAIGALWWAVFENPCSRLLEGFLGRFRRPPLPPAA
jgi:peptidoglycan/LPS O-acetylase OafA/YrhL